MSDATLRWLAVFLSVVALQRFSELLLSARNARRVFTRGGREYGARHFPWLVVLHAFYLGALGAEVVWLDARPGGSWPVWLAAWAAAQALRYASVRALGERWNVRVIVIPGAPLVRTGPYRYLRHPNYLAVVVELFAGPMIFGAWRTALAVCVFNALALRTRIRVENEALRTAGEA